MYLASFPNLFNSTHTTVNLVAIFLVMSVHIMDINQTENDTMFSENVKFHFRFPFQDKIDFLCLGILRR